MLRIIYLTKTKQKLVEKSAYDKTNIFQTSSIRLRNADHVHVLWVHKFRLQKLSESKRVNFISISPGIIRIIIHKNRQV